jgi:hypothetical protein
MVNVGSLAGPGSSFLKASLPSSVALYLSGGSRTFLTRLDFYQMKNGFESFGGFGRTSNLLLDVSRCSLVSSNKP